MTSVIASTSLGYNASGLKLQARGGLIPPKLASDAVWHSFPTVGITLFNVSRNVATTFRAAHHAVTPRVGLTSLQSQH